MRSAEDIAAGFADLEGSCARLWAVTRLHPERSEARQPELSGWSALEHVAHAALANELIVRNLASLRAGAGPLVLAEGEPVPEALEMLARGEIPRGRAQSPRMVRPPARIDRALLEDWLRAGESGFRLHAQASEELARAPGRVPHQLLGPLSAALWVRFAAVHTRHHLTIVDQLLEA